MYTDDIQHDAVGFPGAPSVGIEAAKGFYEHFTANIRTTGEKTLHQFETTDGGMVIEAEMSADVIGEFLGISGNGRSITFRILHVFEFDRDLIRREQVWLDTGSMVAQLTAPAGATATTSADERWARQVHCRAPAARLSGPTPGRLLRTRSCRGPRGRFPGHAR